MKEVEVDSSSGRSICDSILSILGVLMDCDLFNLLPLLPLLSIFRLQCPYHWCKTNGGVRSHLSDDSDTYLILGFFKNKFNFKCGHILINLFYVKSSSPSIFVLVPQCGVGISNKALQNGLSWTTSTSPLSSLRSVTRRSLLIRWIQ